MYTLGNSGTLPLTVTYIHSFKRSVCRHVELLLLFHGWRHLSGLVLTISSHLLQYRKKCLLWYSRKRCDMTSEADSKCVLFCLLFPFVLPGVMCSLPRRGRKGQPDSFYLPHHLRHFRQEIQDTGFHDPLPSKT